MVLLEPCPVVLVSKRKTRLVRSRIFPANKKIDAPRVKPSSHISCGLGARDQHLMLEFFSRRMNLLPLILVQKVPTLLTDFGLPGPPTRACTPVFCVLHHGGLPTLPLRRYRPHAVRTEARTSPSDLSAHNLRTASPGTVDCLSVSCLTYHSFFCFQH